MAQEITNFARFYMTFNKMKIIGDREDMKKDIVLQYTWNRTDSLREMTRKEYDACCDGIERLYGTRDAYREAIRKHRATTLHLMQKIGVDTTDWQRINDFCRDPRIVGKEFARLDGAELEALTVKLRLIRKKGGLKPKADKTQPGKTIYVMLNGDTTLN